MASQDTDTTRTDQLTFQDPVERYPSISPPEDQQPEPGSQQDLTPAADLGEFSYRGTGRLTGRKALVTGGDSGIGAAVAIAFAREGADVAITYLPAEEEDAREVERIITETGRKAALLPGDLTDAEFCAEVVDRAVSALGGLDILVNNAGKQIATESIEEITDEQLESTYQANILAMFRLVKASLKHLQPGSAIINTTSVQAYQPSPTLLDYASTKAAINNFTKGLAQQLAPQGIRVNAVAPGPIWTPLQPSGGQMPEQLPEFGQSVPLGRAGQPTELAPAYVFLASPESSYVLGETLNVNGGSPTP
ncbi:SDR family oxidoreductase [Cellulomonas dongxiuzhuiae]|uniref:SDR family oxidoreductase n=1 Tax=Cellulomonas dongxiuzhuiae TaxID=2819979 RepID=A0ABX8GL28_9CELL|nr:SDR family oxidoreductase [Cellulomonas dongxiuzhuiae]MBO3088858.1 SDR family oxidoreductase [Cellulomonas dongxiuzhuiae]MBO3096417.1 SDR family oxidoreductase [Cellulomonas dongxiuzhuiae]QWC16824.1 SDR family oxidoreductase [Cellulomonas dongxiuzhuiae]